ncbi:MAG: hypothetical protein IT299_10750 [Dehalococcoidia bacterium]|nr:hypothetical protein [Dehalococcoidia bacterium]
MTGEEVPHARGPSRRPARDPSRALLVAALPCRGAEGPPRRAPDAHVSPRSSLRWGAALAGLVLVVALAAFFVPRAPSTTDGVGPIEARGLFEVGVLPGSGWDIGEPRELRRLTPADAAASRVTHASQECAAMLDFERALVLLNQEFTRGETRAAEQIDGGSTNRVSRLWLEYADAAQPVAALAAARAALESTSVEDCLGQGAADRGVPVRFERIPVPAQAADDVTLGVRALDGSGAQRGMQYLVLWRDERVLAAVALARTGSPFAPDEAAAILRAARGAAR